MPNPTLFGLFLTAALLLAITPGPGMFYVLTRSLKGGRTEGIASTFGTSVGGLAHVIASALGLSALLATSSIAFALVKYAGAAYLVYLGIRTLRSKSESRLQAEASSSAISPSAISPSAMSSSARSSSARSSSARSSSTVRGAFRQGIVTEILNPKTALFFLAFIPQFINPQGNLVLQFIVLGSISVALNTSTDLVVALLAGPIGQWLQANPRFRRRQQQWTGWSLIGLGAYVAVADTDR